MLVLAFHYQYLSYLNQKASFDLSLTSTNLNWLQLLKYETLPDDGEHIDVQNALLHHDHIYPNYLI